MRYDHTDWLIHFVRDRDLEQDFPIDDEDEVDYYYGGDITLDASAFCALKTIIRLGGLIPGYSFRSGRTTIYGGSPAICATEMPIYAFANYVKQRNDTDKVSAYGIAFLKSEFFAAGGRPVIYGLSTDSVKYTINKSTVRVFDESILPQHEQYRYVAYNPSGSKWLDWSHEREWRWIVQNEDTDYVWFQNGMGMYGPIGGLPLFLGKENEGFFSKLCIIVWNEEEAKEIQKLLTGFYLAGANDYDTPFSKDLIKSSVIIILDKVISAVDGELDLSSQTIEGLKSEKLFEPVIISTIDESLKEKVNKALKKAAAAGKNAAKKYALSHDLDKGACGFAHVSSYDVTNPIIQYLLEYKLAHGPFDGKVWVSVKEDWPLSQSIDYNEYVCSAICDSLTDELDMKFYVDSKLD